MKTSKKKTDVLGENAIGPQPVFDRIANGMEDQAARVPSLAASSILPLDFSRTFFHMPAGRSDGIYEPTLCGIGERLAAGRVPNDSFKTAFMSYLTINSARLGYPLSALLMPDDPLAAVALLHRVCGLAPSGSYTEFNKVVPEHLFAGGGARLHNKCIVCSDIKGLSKVMPDLEMMLTRGMTIRQEILKKKYEVAVEEFRAEWPVSFLGVAPLKGGDDSGHPAIIRLPVRSSCNISSAVGTGGETQVFDVDAYATLRIKKSFQRLRPRRVVIPFFDQLAEALIKTGGDHLGHKMEILRKVISLCAIMNQPPQVTVEEIGAYIYQAEVPQVQGWPRQARVFQAVQGHSDGTEPIVADKKDLFLAGLLLEGVLTADGVYMTERQRLVYEAIRFFNLGKLAEQFAKADSEQEKLIGITQSASSWAPMEKIFAKVNSGGGAHISMATLYKDIVALMDRGILGRGKPHKKNHYSYYVMRLNLDKYLPIPKPVDIFGVPADGKGLEIVNPVTGQIEAI